MRAVNGKILAAFYNDKTTGRILALTIISQKEATVMQGALIGSLNDKIWTGF